MKRAFTLKMRHFLHCRALLNKRRQFKHIADMSDRLDWVRSVKPLLACFYGPQTVSNDIIILSKELIKWCAHMPAMSFLGCM